MLNYKKHLIKSESLIKEALVQLEKLAEDAIIFVVDQNEKLIGALTDGDIRRGLINGVGINDSINIVLKKNPRFFRKDNYKIEQVVEYRDAFFRIIPILDMEDRIIKVINFRNVRSYLPIDVVIMAGGRGQRLMPFTKNKPKPLLQVGDKPIIEHNLDRLAIFGVDYFWISVNYLGEQIEDYLGNGHHKNVSIEYIKEDKPLGTIGSISLIKKFYHEYVLIINSDILTNIDYEHFFMKFIKKDADMAVVTIPYQVNIPYAVLETRNGNVVNFKEKPTYTYYSNGGIYLIKKSMLKHIPQNEYFNATDLMETLIQNGNNVISYPLVGYWLDIGSHDDYKKAQAEILNIKF